MSRIILFVILVNSLSRYSYCQEKLDYRSCRSFGGKTMDLGSLRGKPILLELMDGQCLACFKKMPFMNKLRESLEDRVEIILLGRDEKKLPGVVEKFQRRYGLKIKGIFDSSLFNSMGATFVPFYVWIDREGNIVRKTNSEFVNEKNLESFAGGDFSFFQESTKRQLSVYDDSYEFSLKDVLLGSFFAKYIDTLVGNTPNRLYMSEFKTGLRIINTKVSDLALLAWFGRRIWYRSDEQHGQVWPFVEYEAGKMDSILNQRVCYSFKSQTYLPPPVIQEQLRRDLYSYFGITGQVIIKEVDCWVLGRKDTGTQFLRSKISYDKRTLSESVGNLEMIAGDLSTLLEIIEYKTQIQSPIIDRTGVLWPIDLSFEADLTDIEDVRKALMGKGLILTKEKRFMQVLVLKEIQEK